LSDIHVNPKDKDIPKIWTGCDFIVIARDEKVERNRIRTNRAAPENANSNATLLSNPALSGEEGDPLARRRKSGNNYDKMYHKKNVTDLLALVSMKLAEAAGASVEESSLDVPFSTSRPMGFVVVSDNEATGSSSGVGSGSSSSSSGGGVDGNRRKVLSQLPTVSTVSEGGPAYVAGVQPGWVVRSVDGVDVKSTAEMVRCLLEAKNSQVHVIQS
jgi:C-terminal processing protease CtpA/Prc